MHDHTIMISCTSEFKSFNELMYCNYMVASKYRFVVVDKAI